MRWMKPLSVAAVLTLMSAPAFAQHTRGGGSESRGRAESRSSGESRGGGEARGGGEVRGGGQSRGGDVRGGAPQQAPSAPRGSQGPQYSRPQYDGGRATPRAVPSVPPGVGRDNRAYNDRSYNDNRSYNYGYGRPAPNVRPYAAPRGGYAYPRGGYAAPRYTYPRAYGYGYGYRPRVIVPVVPYYRPYYTFRPRFSIGVGIFLGYPVPYPYSYGYPSYVYGAGEYAPYSVAPTPGSYGGISFDITPGDADVYIDGTYVGRVADFSPMYQPLTVTPGRHQVELDAPGCEPLLFDVDIQPGQVLPYRGELRPY